jgi:hypothetical protein
MIQKRSRPCRALPKDRQGTGENCVREVRRCVGSGRVEPWRSSAASAVRSAAIVTSFLWVVHDIDSFLSTCALTGIFLFATSLSSLNNSVPAAPSSTGVVIQWNNAALRADRVAKLGAPMVARALAVVDTCMYDDKVTGSPNDTEGRVRNKPTQAKRGLEWATPRFSSGGGQPMSFLPQLATGK